MHCRTLLVFAALLYSVNADCGSCDDQVAIKDPVCAFDGQNYHTFQNPCFLKVAICKYALAGYRLKLVYTGECTDSTFTKTTDPAPTKPTVSGSGYLASTCPTSCPSDTQPVCGTDANTYQNKCYFLQAQCKYAANGMKLGIAYEGRCRTTVVDPGTTLTGVKPGATNDPCAASKTCDATYLSLICGTDGTTYVSKCDFLAAQCKALSSGVRLEMVSEGRCGTKPSTGTSSTLGTVAEKCNMNCDSSETYPICGTDGVTYQNKCYFYQTKCMKDANGERFDVAYVGACRSTSSILTAVGRDVSDCLFTDYCSSVPERICGSDGRTYGSECEFLRAQCANPRLTRVRCGTTLTDAALVDASRTCATDRCDSTAQRICGSDGNTYGSECEFLRAQCSNPRLTRVRCGTTLTDAARLDASRACATDRCDSTAQRICGSDGNTYGSECEFLRAQCANPRLTRVRCGTTLTDAARLDASRTCATDRCDSTAQRICGSDGNTYGSECEFLRAQCSNPRLTRVRCGTTSTDTDGTGISSFADCTVDRCDTTPQRICGSDGNVYGSDCEFQRAQCSNPRLTRVRCTSIVG